jgi:N-acetylmuramoyl-L-alanine amidase
MQLLRLGSRTPAVAEVRTVLAGLGLLDNAEPTTVDLFDTECEIAVRSFQQRRGLDADGIVGVETYRALSSARWRLGDRVLSHNASAPLVGDDVSALQTQLMEIGYRLRADGVFGPTTELALRDFQRALGLVPDGSFGPNSLRGLSQLKRRVVGGRPQLLRDMAAVAEAGPNLLGRRIVIDPAHGGEDPGVVVEGVAEADLVWDLANRLQGRLSAVGVTSWLTRGAANTATFEERARFANEQRADLVISLHVDASATPRANGVATFYWGSGETSSTLGERLADLVQREIVARTGLLDDHTHGKGWALLRLTRMPTVWVEAGYLTNVADRDKLVEPLFRDVLAEAILVAVQRLYLPKESDPPTGVLRMPA